MAFIHSNLRRWRMLFHEPRPIGLLNADQTPSFLRQRCSQNDCNLFRTASSPQMALVDDTAEARGTP